MPSALDNSERIVIGILLFQLMKVPAIPIHNGFSVKGLPFLSKQELKQKTYASLFARIPQELTPKTQKVFPHAFIPQALQGLGCTNQIARLFMPTGYDLLNKNDEQGKKDIVNIPILKEFHETYKIIVVKAPKNLRIGRGDSKDVIIYVVFSEEDGDDPESPNIPQIYFVKNIHGIKEIGRKQSVDPVIIVNNNRTVTGLKSKEISKYVKFKSKLSKHNIIRKI